MKIAPWYLAALAPFAAIGYSGAHLGHALVIVLTVGIFMGTLSLDRAGSSAPRPDSRDVRASDLSRSAGRPHDPARDRA